MACVQCDSSSSGLVSAAVRWEQFGPLGTQIGVGFGCDVETRLDSEVGCGMTPVEARLRAGFGGVVS